MFKKLGTALVAFVIFLTVANMPASANEQIEAQVQKQSEVVVSTKLASPKIRNIRTVGIDSAKITWKSVNGADGYYVYRKAKRARTFKKIATVEDKNYLKDTGLMCGFEYDYKVGAFADQTPIVLSDSEKNTKTFVLPISAVKTFGIKKKDYCFPLDVENVDVTSAYGWRFGGGDFHDGVDFDLNTGDKVMAWKSGYVYKIKTAYESSWGNFVMIYHGKIGGKKIFSGYAHLDRIDVKVGQKVVMGQKIGTGGNTGRSYGSHLHFEIYKGGDSPSKNRVNPTSFVDLENKKGIQKVK